MNVRQRVFGPAMEALSHDGRLDDKGTARRGRRLHRARRANASAPGYSVDRYLESAGGSALAKVLSLRDSRAHDLVLRAVEDHLEIHDAAKRLQRELSTGEISSDTLGEIADMLPRHVRFEEGEVFPAIESAVPHEELHHLGAAGRRDV